MAGFAKPGQTRVAQPFGWFDQLAGLLSRELAPSSRKFRTALRLTTIGTLGAGLIASCHVNGGLGTYIVWLLVGAGPMKSPRKAGEFLIAEAFALIASVVMARALAETPWLTLPFLFIALISFYDLLRGDPEARRGPSAHPGHVPAFILTTASCLRPTKSVGPPQARLPGA